MSRTTLRAAVRATAVTLLVAGSVGACGSDDERSAEDAQEVVAGVVLESSGGQPASGVDVELLVWPSPQAGTTAPVGEMPELIRVDEASTAVDGSFDLEALAEELSPHASSDGQVGLEIRRVGSTEAGARMTVRLSRSEGTGEITVHTVEGLELTSQDIGGS